MWQIRGGFQDRDVGRSNLHDDNYGPEHGIDYARFSDPPDPAADNRLFLKVHEKLKDIEGYEERGILVRNGFVFLKGSVNQAGIREEITRLVREVPGVREVQNFLVLTSSSVQ